MRIKVKFDNGDVEEYDVVEIELMPPFVISDTNRYSLTISEVPDKGNVDGV